MAQPDTTYATVADWKARMPNIGASDTSRNAAIQGWLNAAANMIDNYTGRAIQGIELFTATTSTTRYFDDILSDSGKARIDDAQTVTAVSRGTVSVNAAYYQLYPYNKGLGPYTTLLFRRDVQTSWEVIIAGSWYGFPYRSGGAGQLAVTGTWGYCTQNNRPPEILEATCIQAIRMYEQANLPTKEIINSLVNPFRGLDPLVKEMIEPFREKAYF